MLGVLVLGVTGCLEEPLRTNPFDPRSDDFVNEGIVTGRVANRASEPLADVTVRLTRRSADTAGTTPSFTTQSGAEGQFRFSEVEMGSYRLVAEKAGYAASAARTIEVDPGGTTKAGRLILNALPVFTRVVLRTLRVEQPAQTSDALFLEVMAEVEDPDAQPGIDSVLLAIPEEDYTVELLRALDPPNRFVRSLPESALPAGLHALLGRSMRLVARDRDGAVSRTPPQKLVRVIEASPVPVAPQGTVTETTLTFSWEPVQLPYSFTYRVEVVRREGGSEVLAARIEEIPSDRTQVQVTLSLAPEERPKDFYWTVSAVDRYGDEGRSAPMSFTIE